MGWLLLGLHSRCLAKARILSPPSVSRRGFGRQWEAGEVTVLPWEYGYLGLMTLRFDSREYLRSRSFRILEPRDSPSSLSLSLSFYSILSYSCTANAVCHACNIHTRARSLTHAYERRYIRNAFVHTQRGGERALSEISSGGTLARRERPREISRDVAVCVLSKPRTMSPRLCERTTGRNGFRAQQKHCHNCRGVDVSSPFVREVSVTLHALILDDSLARAESHARSKLC